MGRPDGVRLEGPEARSRLGDGRCVEADDEASILVAPEGKIGLEDVATEQLYLNLPLKPICSPACKGLCPECGTNRNLGACECVTEDVDPRLAPLLPFKKKLQGLLDRRSTTMPNPKRRHSRARRDKRRAHDALAQPGTSVCTELPGAQAAAPRLPALRVLQGPRGRRTPVGLVEGMISACVPPEPA